MGVIASDKSSVFFQHYYSVSKRKMRPTAGHKLCQTSSTNLHFSVFPTKSRRAMSRAVVLILAHGCQKCGRKLPAIQRLWKCLSGDCRCGGQCWTLWQWSIHMEQGVRKTFPAGRTSSFASCLNQKPNPHSCFTISLHFAARNQPVQRL